MNPLMALIRTRGRREPCAFSEPTTTVFTASIAIGRIADAYLYVLFFREYAGELRIIALRRKKLFKVYNAGLKSHTHTSTKL